VDSTYRISISHERVEAYEDLLEPSVEFGADLRFHGIVRGLEDGRVIRGIDYSCYEGMALKELERLCQDMTADAPRHRVLVHHRLGFVAAGEASIVVRVQAPHSKEAYQLCQEYLARIKTTVPIWKGPVFEDETEA